MTSDINFETLLGKNINEVSFFGAISRFDNENMYWISNPDQQFLGKSYDRMFIITNEQGTIQEITLYFPGILDRFFFEKISDKYGHSDRDLVIDEILYDEPEEEIGNYVVKESFYTVKEGDSDNDSLYHFWDKTNFQIRMFFDYANNKTDIRFNIGLKD